VRDGAVVARTLKSSATRATFWKGSRYAVDVLRLSSDRDKIVIPIRRAVAFKPRVARKARAARSGLVFRPAPKIDFRLRLVRQTKRTVTFSWKRQSSADGYRFLRNGVAVAQTFDRSTTTATFWRGSRYAVEVLRVAQDKRVTAVMRALAYTRLSAPSSGSGQKPGSGSGGPAIAPSPSGGTDGSRASGPNGAAQPPARSNEPSSSAPKPPSVSPKPSTKPAPPPPSQPAPAPPSPTPPAPTSPAVGPGGVVRLSGTYSPNAFFQAVAVAPPGAVRVTGNYTVSGSVDVDRPSLRIDGATINGTVTFRSSATGSSLVNSSATGFSIEGADGVVIDGSVFDGGGQVSQNFVWAVPAPDPVNGFTIRNSTFRNYTSENTTLHSEALFIGGYSRNGLIEGNTFTNNGNTAHIFFSWCAPNDCDGGGGRYAGDPRDPSNICVKGNTFNQTWEAYYDVMVRQENGGGISTDDNIRIAPGQPHMSTTTSVPGRLVQLLPGDNLKFQLGC
jgi:hypothetical protein